MTSPLDTGNRWVVLGVATFGLTCLGLAADHAPALALVNESPSVPRGVYVRQMGSGVRRGDTVALRQPEVARPYLAGLGMPMDVRLLKRVAAAEGDRVCRLGDRVTAGTRSVAAASRDRRGMTLPRWTDCRRLAAGEVFLLGDTPGSFDSRYFGPVRVADLDGVFREALTW